MANVDYKSSVPVRTESDANEKVQVKICDPTNPDTQQAIVDTDKNLHVLAAGHTPAGASVTERLSEEGAPNPDGFYSVSNNSVPATTGVIGHTRGATIDATKLAQRVTGIQGSGGPQGATVIALDISLHDELGNAYTETNPLPVVLAESKGGTPLHDYNDNANVPAGTTVNHDYTVPAAKSLDLSQVLIACSGRGRMELMISTDGGTTWASKLVRFSSAVNNNPDALFAKPLQLLTGNIVRLSVMDMDKQNFDIHSTFVGTLF